jgi:hypothetical protein
MTRLGRYYQKKMLDKLARGERLWDWVWIPGKHGQWRPVDKYTTVKRGKKKGQYRCTLPDGKQIVVPKSHLRLEKNELRKVL